MRIENRTTVKIGITILFLFGSPLYAGVSLDSNGWTVVTPSADTQIVYVSQTDPEGCQAYSANHTGPITTCRTISEAKDLMRDGFPDHLLLKKGDEFSERIGTLVKSGRSSQEPMLFGSYGSGARPLLNTGNSNGMSGGTNSFPRVEFIVVMGLHFKPHTYDGSGQNIAPAGVRWVATGECPLFEDNVFEGYATNLTIQEATYGPLTNLRIRRNLILDAYHANGTHSQGIFLNHVDGVLIEENIFDHNGWKEGVEGAEATVYNHNVYVNVNTLNVVARGNIFSRASATGIQARTGGIVEDNLFIQNPIALTFGQVSGGSEFKPIRDRGVSGTIKNNVVLEATDIDTKERGQGFSIANINSDGLEVSGNIIAHDQSGNSNSIGMIFSQSNGPQGLQNVLVQNNIIFDWINKGISLETSSTQPLQNIRIENNQLQHIGTNGAPKSYAHIAHGIHPEVTQANNIYFAKPHVAPGNWFRSSQVNRTFEWWRDNMEPTAIRNKQNYEDSNVSVASYHGSLGGTATFDAFIQKLRSQSKDSWDTRYMAQAINDYIHEGFQVNGSLPPPPPPPPPPNPGTVTQDSNGWTVVTPADDSRIIYVSDSDGNDVNDGFSPSKSKKTISEGLSLLRDGFPDHLLLKKGDTFTNQNLGGWWRLSGRNANEPMVIGTYGTGLRPRVLTGNENGLVLNRDDNPVKFLVIEGLYLEPHTRDPAKSVTGLSLWNSGGSDIIVENNHINGFGWAMRVRGSTDRLDRVQVRRNILRNSYNLKATGHSQGLFATHVDTFLIEENIFDHNGWHDSIPDADGTKFNHNMYLTGSKPLTNLTIRGNFSSRGSNMGLKFQPYSSHHVIENNLFVRNGYGVQVGGGVPQNYGSNGITVDVRNNIVTENQSNGAASTIGYTFANIASGLFQNNILANSISDASFYSMYITDGNGWEAEGIGVRNLVMDNNIVYNWTGEGLNIDTPLEGSPLPDNQNITFTNNHLQLTRSGNEKHIIRFKTQADRNDFTFANNKYHHENRSEDAWFRVQGVSYDLDDWMAQSGETGAVAEKVDYPDPTRTTLTYAQSLGLDTYDQLIAEMIKQSKENWRPEFTATSINNYIRFGFGKESVDPPLPPPPPSPDPNPTPVPTPDPVVPIEKDPEKIVNVLHSGNSFNVEVPCEDVVLIYTISGDLVDSLSCSGDFVIWNASQYASGTYVVYRLNLPPKKVVVIK